MSLWLVFIVMFLISLNYYFATSSFLLILFSIFYIYALLFLLFDPNLHVMSIHFKVKIFLQHFFVCESKNSVSENYFLFIKKPTYYLEIISYFQKIYQNIKKKYIHFIKTHFLLPFGKLSSILFPLFLNFSVCVT